MWTRFVVLSLLAGMCAVPSPTLAQPPQVISGAVRWSGEVRLHGPVQIDKGGSLEIAPGSVIRLLTPAARIAVLGELHVAGTAKHPVLIAAAAKGKGIELFESPRASTFSFVQFRNVETAISSNAARFTVRHSTFQDCNSAIRLLRESLPVVEDSLFEGNQVGIDNQTKSAATIRRNLFRGHAKAAILTSYSSRSLIEKNRFEANTQGIALLQNNPGRILDNQFSANQTGIYCFQTQNTPEIAGNSFNANQTAIANVSFASPTIHHNQFIDNNTAIHNDQLGTALIRHNLFRNNKTALYNYRRSSPVVENNVLERNGLALFCDYSSYPSVHRNNFVGNGMGVRLGIYQSGDWERQFGSGALMRKEVLARQGKNPHLPKPATDIKDVVDVSDNWWGDDTVKLKQAGAAGNLEMFHDRHDQPLVVYEGYGAAGYALDVVRYAPWLTTQVLDSGPKP